MTATAIRPRSTMRTTFIASSGRGLEATALGVGTNYFTLRESLQRAPSRSGRAAIPARQRLLTIPVQHRFAPYTQKWRKSKA